MTDLEPIQNAPAILPVGPAARERFATHKSLCFGWTATTEAHPGQFQLAKLAFSGGAKPVQLWPMSEEGWREAWAFLVQHHPQLAAAVRAVWAKDAALGQYVKRRAQLQSALNGEGVLDRLPRCVLLGGYGYADNATPGSRVDLHFTTWGIWMTEADEFSPLLRCAYETVRHLEFKGGAIRKGGGYVGGGFGVLGAAEGMAIAGLLNALTTSTEIQTTMRVESDTAEAFLFTDTATPQQLTMRLSQVRGRIRRSDVAPAAPAAAVPGGVDLTDRLLRLGEMLDKGQLTPDEFARAKARLLDISD